MAFSTSDLEQNRDQFGNPIQADNRLTDQRTAARDQFGNPINPAVDRDGRVSITVDGNEYRVLAGTHSMASLTKTALLMNPPNFLGAKALHSQKGEKYQAADSINIEGGEVFTSSTITAPLPGGFNRQERPDSHVVDNRTAAQRAADGADPMPVL
jgi:hypothetical protein